MQSKTSTRSGRQLESATEVAGGGGQRPLAVSIADCQRLTSLGRTSVFAMINTKQLAVVRVGRRTLVLMHSIETLLGLSQENS